MKIELQNIGRRFNREWIFRKLDYNFLSGSSYAILGQNGSGKSTLLRVISGSLTPSEGKISYDRNGGVDADSVYSEISWAAPYIDLIEEFTLSELIDFHFKFKPYFTGLSKEGLIDQLGLGKSRNKEIKFFSSGMKQRTKLALAICSNTSILLLDEPTSNLDTSGIEWYQQLISNYSKDRLVIICSNQEHEYSFSNYRLYLSDYK